MKKKHKLTREVERAREGHATPAELDELFGKLAELKPEELRRVVGGMDDPHSHFDS